MDENHSTTMGRYRALMTKTDREHITGTERPSCLPSQTAHPWGVAGGYRNSPPTPTRCSLRTPRGRVSTASGASPVASALIFC